MAGCGRIVLPAGALGTGSHGRLGMVPVDFWSVERVRSASEGDPTRREV